MRRFLLLTLVCAGVAMIAAGAARPVGDPVLQKHPNLAAAQKLLSQSYDKITAAQKANEFDQAGHASKAKDLLEQASAELKLAVESGNDNKGEK